MQNIFEHLIQILKQDERLISQDGILLKNRVQELARKNDPTLIKRLLLRPEIKQHFFFAVEAILIFDKEKFIRFISHKQFLPDSYTAFKNKIGLVVGDSYLSKTKEVVLTWPYKECVLEGGMTKEDQKRDEIFYNETLAPDDITRLLDAKVFTNFKRIDKTGEHTLTKFTRDEKGVIKDNLIIKGNNLLAIASLKQQFTAKIKLIYIDPPYNTKGPGDTFTYNNTFKHSTWLTFMKNRLEVAKTLLREDGVIIVAIDENEQAYLGVLIDEIFPEYENHCVTIVHNPRGIIGKNFSYTHEYAYFIIPKGKKTIENRKIKEKNIDWRGLRDNGGESFRTDAKNCFYPIIVDKCTNQIIDFGNVCEDEFHPKVNIHKGDFVKIYPIDSNGVERKWRYARQSIEKMQDLLRAKNVNGIYDIQIGKDFGMYRTVWVDRRYDANEYGTKLINSLVPDNMFSFPKSLWNVYDCVYSVVGDDKNAIILDYHAGSGTTAHAVLELNKEDGGNRKFILVEQMDYINTVTCPRVQKVLEKENLDDHFIYMDLTQWNEQWKEKIETAKTANELAKIWSAMQESAFLSYKVDPKTVNAYAKDFANLALADQKKFLMECLDKNHLYVNLSEIDDAEYRVSKADKQLNGEFYGV